MAAVVLPATEATAETTFPTPHGQRCQHRWVLASTTAIPALAFAGITPVSTTTGEVAVELMLKFALRRGRNRPNLDRLQGERRGLRLAGAEQLRRKLAKAQAVIEVQGKDHALLEEISRSAEPETE